MILNCISFIDGLFLKNAEIGNLKAKEAVAAFPGHSKAAPVIGCFEITQKDVKEKLLILNFQSSVKIEYF